MNYHDDFPMFCEINRELAQQIFEEEKPHLTCLTNNGDLDPMTDSVVVRIMFDLREGEQKLGREIDTSSLYLDKYCEHACDQ